MTYQRARIAVLPLLGLVLTVSAHAQCTAATSRGIVVAHESVIQLFDHGAAVWTSEGLANATTIVAGTNRIAVVDPLANKVRIVDIAAGRGITVQTGETPIDGIFMEGSLYLLERDARALERIGSDGTRASISTGADPAFVRAAGRMLYVYSRGDGLVQEISPVPFATRRSLRTVPFASDFVAEGGRGYLVDPQSGKVALLDLNAMKPAGTLDAGAVPVALALVGAGTSLTGPTVAVADPSAKKVWLVEGAQSTAQAFARGFVRGLIGLGLFESGASLFPTGVDRLYIRGSRWYALDSASGTLYRFTRSSSSIAARHVSSSEIVVTHDGVFFWNDAVRRLQQAD